MHSEGLFSNYDKVSEEQNVPLLDDVVEPELPRLIISHNGQVVHDVKLTATRTLVGRSELSDVILENQYVSKQHAISGSVGRDVDSCGPEEPQRDLCQFEADW